MLVLNPITAVYELILKRAILKSPITLNHILLVLNESDLLPDDSIVGDSTSTATKGLVRLKHFIRWCDELSINVISIYIAVIQGDVSNKLLDAAHEHLRKAIISILSRENAYVAIYTGSSASTICGEGGVRRINVSIGMGGRSELTKAIRAIAKRVERGEVEPEDIDEKMIESHLIFKSEPDLVIKSGTTSLTDFLIWQSVYSEFYFTDVNWQNFRKIDLLRAVRDFKWRERRFGR